MSGQSIRSVRQACRGVFGRALLIGSVLSGMVGGEASAIGAEPGTSMSPGAGDATGFYTDPATGIVYRQVRRTVDRPFVETEMKPRETTVYRPEVVVEVRPETRTVYAPVVNHVWEPKVRNRWNPFMQPTVQYEHTPKTHWEVREETIQRQETRTRWVTEKRQDEVPHQVMKIRREEVVELEPVGRITPESGLRPVAMSDAVAARLRPIDSPLADPRFTPGQFATQAPVAQVAANPAGYPVGSRNLDQIGMRATDLRPGQPVTLGLGVPTTTVIARQPALPLWR
ncbi:MAG: hypothetical protein EA381_02710 [Planctomycetaceae bacterium]|nr:MAG: hypothetical protein EA381_02710 [Planctomycetaceae bacterium]